jgi:hypothetical protein
MIDRLATVEAPRLSDMYFQMHTGASARRRNVGVHPSARGDDNT